MMELKKKVGDLFCRGAQGEQIRSPTFFLSSIIFTSKITPTCRNGRARVKFSHSCVRALAPTTTHQQSVCNAMISNICGTIWQPGNHGEI